MLLLQFLVDISTPASVLDSISQAVQAHMDETSTEYKGDSLTVSFSSCDDPLKVQLVVSFEYSHNGEQHVVLQLALLASASTGSGLLCCMRFSGLCFCCLSMCVCVCVSLCVCVSVLQAVL